MVILFRWLRIQLLLCCCAVALSAEPIQSIETVQQLSEEVASRGLPVTLEGQVVRMHAKRYGFFLFDGVSGLYVGALELRKPIEHIEVGDLVVVTGHTDAGDFSPSIKPEKIERLGHADLPDPRPFSIGELYDTTIDSDWVSVVGRLNAVSLLKSHSAITFDLELDGVGVAGQLPYSQEALARLEQLLFRQVRFSGVAGSISNQQRQLVGRVFYVNSVDDLVPVDDYEGSEELGSYALHELMRAGTNPHDVVETYGVVTYAMGHELYLRGEAAALRVLTRELPDVALGDTVELLGFAWPQAVSPGFRAIHVDVIDSGEPPEPLDTQFGASLDPRLNHELVRIQARLIDVGKRFEFSPTLGEEVERVSLLCRSGPYLLEAHLPAGLSLKGVQPGAQLELTGICLLSASSDERWYLFLDTVSLRLRGVEDVRVLTPAPWWTSGRLLGLFGGTLLLSGLFLVWVLVLRRTVRKQTAIIRKQVKHESVLDERQRIARELHDNLEQGLAGMAIQLRAVLKLLERQTEKSLRSILHAVQRLGVSDDRVKQDLEQGMDELREDVGRSQAAVQVVQGMLKYCSEESRSSILELRGGLRERADFVTDVRATVERFSNEYSAVFTVEVDGAAPRLKYEAERNLLLIVKELVTNAVRHGRPERVDVRLVYRDGALSLKVLDDGCGFDARGRARQGSFGLIGVRERIQYLKASLDIESELSRGTVVTVTMPFTKIWDLEDDA